MRLSTLVLAWTFAALTGTAALAEQGSSPTPPVAEAGAPPASDALTPEDSAALDVIAPEAADVADAAEATAPEAPEPAADTPVTEAVAEAAAPAESAPDVSWEDFEDPSFDPSEPAAGPAPRARLSARASAITIGPMGVDENGVEGRIHTVSRGDTLWDISEAYLGTPWVWPSVWDENERIENPHRIDPGDRIWITSNEMRRISDEEAARRVAAVPDDAVASDDLAFLPGDEIDDFAAGDAEPLPAAVEDEPELSVLLPATAPGADTGDVIVLPQEPDAHFASVDLMDRAVKIADAPEIRAFLAQGDRVYLPLGEGQVQVGDEFDVFRDVVKIRDVETRAVLGYHYDELGWLRVTHVEGESSTAVIQGSSSEIERGDRIIPRTHTPQEIAVRRALDDIQGAIVFTPGIRWMRGTADSVYINVGSIHGVELGTRMQVIEPGRVQEAAQMPDTVVAELVVIGVEPETSIAYITETDRELEVGDDVRGVMADDPFAMP